MMIRMVIAATLIAVFGVSAASASGRSKDERAAFWQTVKEGKQPWRPAKAPVGAQPAASTAPAAVNKAPTAAKPAQ